MRRQTELSTLLTYGRRHPARSIVARSCVARAKHLVSVTDKFSGRVEQLVGRLCSCVCRRRLSNKMIFDLDIWQAESLSPPFRQVRTSKVKVQNLT